MKSSFNIQNYLEPIQLPLRVGNYSDISLKNTFNNSLNYININGNTYNKIIKLLL